MPVPQGRMGVGIEGEHMPHHHDGGALLKITE